MKIDSTLRWSLKKYEKGLKIIPSQLHRLNKVSQRLMFAILLTFDQKLYKNFLVLKTAIIPRGQTGNFNDYFFYLICRPIVDVE